MSDATQGPKVIIDAAQAGWLALGQWPKHRALCCWCLPAAGATFAALPLAAPEVMEAWNNLTAGPKQAALPGTVDDLQCGPRTGGEVHGGEA